MVGALLALTLVMAPHSNARFHTLPCGHPRISVTSQHHSVRKGFSEDSTESYWMVGNHPVRYFFGEGFQNATPYIVHIHVNCGEV